MALLSHDGVHKRRWHAFVTCQPLHQWGIGARIRHQPPHIRGVDHSLGRVVHRIKWMFIIFYLPGHEAHKRETLVGRHRCLNPSIDGRMLSSRHIKLIETHKCAHAIERKGMLPTQAGLTPACAIVSVRITPGVMGFPGKCPR